MTSILQHSDWLNGRVPDTVRTRLRQLVEVVGYLPYEQPLGVVTADAVLLAANRPFLDLLGASNDEQLGADWDDFMPGWSARTGQGDGGAEAPTTQTFEDCLLPAGGGSARVVACPVFASEPGGQGREQRKDEDEALAAWAVFILDERTGDGGRSRQFGVSRDTTRCEHAEDAARRRVDLESMVATVSTRLAGAGLDQIPLAVDFALGETGRRLGADRVSLYLLAPDGVTLKGVRVWRRDTGQHEDGDTTLGVQRLRWLREHAAAEHALVPQAADALAIPVFVEPTLVGLLALEIDGGPGSGGSDRRWAEDDISLVRLIADQLATLYVRRADELDMRSIADCFLAFGPDVEKNLTHICHAAARITAADTVLYCRRRGRELVTEAGWNVPDGLARSTHAEGRLDSWVMEQPAERVHVERDLQQTTYALTSPVVGRVRARTYAGLTVRIGRRPVGALSCLFTGDVTLRESQVELLRVLGRSAAVEEERRRAIEDRVLGLAQLEQAMERMVGTLSGAVGMRDPYTAGHEKRVGQLAVAIGRKVGLDTDDLRLLRLAATVHDLGKITVPAEILSKPTRLSEPEFAIIRRHSEAGWELLEPAGLPASVTDAVLQHHERLDGSGYPEGLRDGEIGEFARIIAVADVVEAMSSHRPYRPAIGVEPALEEIEQGRGTRYDARAADACVELFREAGFAFSE